MTDRKPDRVYVLNERQFIESVLVGANSKRYLPPDLIANVQRCAVEHADNGGVVLRIWCGEPAGALEPQVLLPFLQSYEKELPGPVPSLKEVQSWAEADLLEVSTWVRALHARAHPIAGMVLPEIGDQPLVLFDAVGKQPKPTPRGPSEARKKKRIRQQRAPEPEAAESDPRERPGGGP